MPFSINPDLIENNDVEIQTVDGELALFHKPSGNTLIIDEDTTVSEKLQSPLRDDVDFDGNDLISGGSGEFAALDAESVNTDELPNTPKLPAGFEFPFEASDYEWVPVTHLQGDAEGSDPDLDVQISDETDQDDLQFLFIHYSFNVRDTDLRLQINGEESNNYNWETLSGPDASSADHWRIAAHSTDTGNAVGGYIFIQATDGRDAAYSCMAGCEETDVGDMLVIGDVDVGTFSIPIESVQIFDENETVTNFDVSIFGGVMKDRVIRP